MTMEILKVQDLCKTYGKGEAKVEALKKVSFSLDKGECYFSSENAHSCRVL